MRAVGVAHVGLEIGVELVRERQPRVELERAAERRLPRASWLSGELSMNLPMTR